MSACQSPDCFLSHLAKGELFHHLASVVCLLFVFETSMKLLGLQNRYLVGSIYKDCSFRPKLFTNMAAMGNSFWSISTNLHLWNQLWKVLYNDCSFHTKVLRVICICGQLDQRPKKSPLITTHYPKCLQLMNTGQIVTML